MVWMARAWKHAYTKCYVAMWLLWFGEVFIVTGPKEVMNQGTFHMYC